MTARKPSTIAGLRRGIGTAKPSGDLTPEIGHAVADLPSAPLRPEKPVRLTVDLTPAVHRALRDFAADTGPGVSAAETLRAMIAVAVADKGIAAEVRDHIRQARTT